MAIYQWHGETSTTLTWGIGGFSELASATRTFKFYLNGNYVASVTRGPGTTDVQYTYTGLTPRTSYDLKATMTTNSGTSDTYTYTGTDQTIPESTSNDVSVSGWGSDGALTIYATFSKDPTYYKTLEFYVDGSSVGSHSVYNQTSDYITVNGNEGQTYNISVKLSGGTSPDGQAGTSVTIPYDTAISASVFNVTDTSATINAYGLGANKQYGRTLKWYKQGPSDSTYILLGQTTISAGTYDTSFTYPLSNLRANTSYSFKVELYNTQGLANTAYASVITSETPGNLTCEETGESSLRMLLSDMTSPIGRKIKWWYKKSSDSVYYLYATTTLTDSTTSTRQVIEGLLNNVIYNVKAEICDANDNSVILGTKTATATTAKQEASLSLDKNTSVSIRVLLNNMEAAVSYSRVIYWYIKRSVDSAYTEAGSDTVPADSSITSISKLFEGLVSSTLGSDGSITYSYYDIKAVIKKNDSAVIATLVRNYNTTLRDSDIPSPEITALEQEIGTLNCDVYWEAPEHIISTNNYVTYSLERSEDGTNYTAQASYDVPPAKRTAAVSYDVIALPAYSTMYYYRVKATLTADTSKFKYSNVATVTAEQHFSWGSIAAGQPCVIQAVKWNLLIRYIKKKLADNNITTQFKFTNAIKGAAITADNFNELVTAINAFHATGIAAKHSGDQIIAADLILLANAVNA